MKFFELVQELRKFRCKSLTHFAQLLETAAKLQAFRPTITQVDYLEVNSRGYTMAQTKQGSWKAAKKANAHALARHWAEVALILVEQNQDVLVEQTARLLLGYGVEFYIAWQPVRKMRTQREEEYLWCVYCKEGRAGILRQTYPA